MDSTGYSLVQRLVQAGYIAYFAGGYVRDKLLNLPCEDIDIATSAPPHVVMELFPKTILVGLRFGSVVVVEEGKSFEVTTFRSEGPYLDGRHPSSVTLSDAREDAQRRDFTINGLFFDPLTNEVIDYVGGQHDLKAKCIRAIGNPDDRFEEDKLRMIRAVRFAVRFGFTIEPATAAAIKRHASSILPTVSVERIWQELKKVKERGHFGPFVHELHRLGLLEVLFPGGEVPSNHFDKIPLECPTMGFVIPLFPKASLEAQMKLCETYKVSNAEMAFVQLLHEAEVLEQGAEAHHWVAFYAQPEADLALRVIAAKRGEGFLHTHRLEQQRLAAHIQRERLRQPLVTARDLQALGVSNGPKMGQLLKQAQRLAIQHDLHTKEQVLARLRG